MSDPCASRAAGRALAALALVALGACRPATGPDGPVPQLTFERSGWWPDTSGYPGVGGGKVLVVNTRGDSVSLFELAQVAPLVEVARPSVGLSPVDLEAPRRAAVERSGAHYFIALSRYAPGSGGGPRGAQGGGTVDGSVLKVRARDNARVAWARVDRSPSDLALSPDGTTLAVAHHDLVRVNDSLLSGGSPDARVVLLDAETMEVTQRLVVCPAPRALAFSPDGGWLYAACSSDELAVVRLPAGEVKRVKVAANAGDAHAPRYQPFGLAVAPSGDEVWVSCLSTGEARVYDVGRGAFDDARTAKLGGRAMRPAFGAGEGRLWVPRQGDAGVAEVDARSGALRRMLSLPAGCPAPLEALEAPGGEKLLVLCEGDGRGPGRLFALDVASGAAIADAPTGAAPDGLALVRVP